MHVLHLNVKYYNLCNLTTLILKNRDFLDAFLIVFLIESVYLLHYITGI